MATLVSSFLLLLLPILLLSTCCHGSASQTRGMFVFGSSLVDNGNNNFLENTTAKADYLPYGIDSDEGPSGRFSNGKNMIDALGELLHLPAPIPPFLHPNTKGRRIVHGVNYASGGSGILDQTGSIGGTVISLSKQITNFERTTLPELRKELNRQGPAVDQGGVCNALSDYLFIMGTGGNDYLLNYFTNKAVASEIGLEDFTTNLIFTLSSHLKRLYDLGARKFVLMSVQAIGCVPVVKANIHTQNGSCVEAINEAAVLFNARLRTLVDSGKPEMAGSHMVFINSYNIIKSIIHNPKKSGFTDTSRSCCAIDTRNGVLCRKGGRTCRGRHAHLFFDGLHPTEAVNVWIAKKAYDSNLSHEAYPINVKKLARI